MRKAKSTRVEKKYERSTGTRGYFPNMPAVCRSRISEPELVSLYLVTLNSFLFH